MYEQALAESGFPGQLEYVEVQKEQNGKRIRRRRITWFNPPYSRSVSTNVGKKFLALVRKHFGKPDSPLAKIFNPNTLKVSYSCIGKMADIIRSHNSLVLKDFIDQKARRKDVQKV